jgi:hypothetical protein
VTLASMLRIKIAQIHDQQPLQVEPSSRIEEISEQWPDRRRTSQASFGIDNSRRPDSPQYLTGSSQKDDEDNVVRGRGFEDVGGLELNECQQQSFQDGQLPWASTIGDELTTTLANSSDLYQQVQDFDGSFDSFQLDNLEPFLSDNDFLQRVAGERITNNLTTNPIFSQWLPSELPSRTEYSLG